MDKNIKEIFKYLKIYKKNILVISVSMLAITIGSIISPLITKKMIDSGLSNGDLENTVKYVGYLFCIFLIQQLIVGIQFWDYAKVSIGLPFRLNMDASLHILKIRIKYFKEKNFSTVISELFQDIANISSLADSNLLSSFVKLFEIIAGIVALCLISWKLTLIIIAIIPIRVICSRFFFGKEQEVFIDIMRNQSSFSSWLGDCISGINEIRLWGLEDEKTNSVKNILREGNKYKRKLLCFKQIDTMLSTFFTMLITCILYCVGSYLISIGELTMGGLVAFIAYSSLVTEPITIIAYLVGQISSILPAINRFKSFMDTEKEDDSVEYSICNAKPRIESLEFKNVSFSYDRNQNSSYILKNINFIIEKGERVAIIGKNGSGKTSIINLLLRFYKQSEGEVLLNGKDIKTLDIKQYRALFSCMLQNFYLFNDTVSNNINLVHDLDENELLESCEKAGAINDIRKLGDGFETIVGYNGAKLSGGQRQKIALSRTFAKKGTQILILDEATSNFDYYSENYINDILVNKLSYVITIVITHRPEILKNMDKIIYLSEGRVMDVGKFEDIYQKYSEFRELVTYEEGGIENAI